MNRHNETKYMMASANEGYALPMKRCISSLFKTQPGALTLYIIYSELSEESLEWLSNIEKQYKGKKTVCVRVSQDIIEGLPTTGFSAEVWYKTVGIGHLPEDAKRVICFDLDMIFEKPVDELFSLDMQGKTIAACFDIYGEVYGAVKENNNRLGLPAGNRYFNGGFIMVDVKRLKEKGGAEFILEKAHEAAGKYKLTWLEQDVYNLLFHDDHIEIPWALYDCPPVRYVMKVQEASRGIFKPLTEEEARTAEDLSEYADYTAALSDYAAVIHYIAQTKPWIEGRIQAESYEVFDRHWNEAQ